MTEDAWQTVGRIASTAGVTATAYSGVQVVVKSYQAYISPDTFLMESERRLKRVRSRLDGLSKRRREEIEAATQSYDSGCKPLESLEEQLDDLMDTYCRLSKRSDEAWFPERHNPFSEFRQQVSGLVQDARALLNDTMKTTVPFVDDIGFDPKKLRWGTARPSKSESLDSSSTTSAPYPDAGAIRMSRVK